MSEDWRAESALPREAIVALSRLAIGLAGSVASTSIPVPHTTVSTVPPPPLPLLAEVIRPLLSTVILALV